MQLNNHFQLEAFLKEKNRIKLEKISHERQLRLMSFIMVMGSLVAVISLLKA